MDRTTVRPNAQPSRFARFMAAKPGRTLRVAVGAVMVGSGLVLVGGPLGVGIALAGLVPIATGALNLCPIAPLWGGHFLGAKYCESGTRRS